MVVEAFGLHYLPNDRLMKYLILPVLLIVNLTAYAQTFEFTQTALDIEVPTYMIEKENGHFISVSTYGEDVEANYRTLIREFSREGELIQTADFPYIDTLSSSTLYIEIREDTIVAISSEGDRDELTTRLWYSIFADDFSVIEHKLIGEGYDLLNITDVQKISGDRYTITGFIHSGGPYFHGYVAVINRNGELLQENEYEGLISKPTAIMEKNDNTGFILKVSSRGVALINSDLEVDTIVAPFELDVLFGADNTMKRLDDSTYFMSGTHEIFASNNDNIGIKKIRHTDKVLASGVFGTPDSTEVTALTQSLDFVYPDKIYCGGWQRNFDTHPFLSEYPGWLILSQYDEDLNLNWTRYYGGDAFYVMEGVLATQDGGCLIYSRRYAFTGFFDYDIHILKVNPDGLLTSTTTPETSTNITVYPNPTSNYIFFDTGEASMYDVSFFDGLGKVIFQEKIPNNRPVDVRHLPVGMYTYVLEREGEIVSQGKWVKE